MSTTTRSTGPMESPPSVAIIGAGPSGLVTAKNLLHLPAAAARAFRLRIFDKAPNVGGLWPIRYDASHGLMNPRMRTNLCRFTVCFSDLSWQSSTGSSGAHQRFTPLYPKAWQVGQYLQQYYQRYIPDSLIYFSTTVTTAARVRCGDGFKWQVTAVNSATNEAFQETFDFLVVASGLFPKPRSLEPELDGLKAAQAAVPIVHSSAYRGLSDLAVKGTLPESGKIAVIGGSHSGGEIAASMALDATANDNINRSETRSLQIIHVAPHPMYAIPPFIQLGGDNLNFAPIDFSLYDLSGRTEETINFTFGKTDEEQERALRKQIAGIIHGADPPDAASSALVEPASSGTPYAIINEQYVEFVRSGAIVPKIGRAASLSVQPNQLLSVRISSTEKLQDVAAIVYATGFETTASLDFLQDLVKEQLGFDPTLPRLPLKLDIDFNTTTAALPDMALVGFGGAPYWGILEMQARKVAEGFAKMAEGKPYVPSTIDGLSEEVERLRDMLRNGKPIPQNILGDYPGYMEQAARNMSLARTDLAWNSREGMVCPARYIDPGSNNSESETTMKELQMLKSQALEETRFLARAVFRSLHGTWKADVTSRGKIEDGDLVSTMNFYPRRSNGGDFDWEYICTIDDIGHLNTDRNNHRLVWRYEESADQISTWSTEKENDYAALNLEQFLQFQKQHPDGEKDSVLAQVTDIGGGHAAFPFSSLRFTFRGVHLTQLGTGDGSVIFTR